MSTTTAENYVRLHLLNVKGCAPVLREVVLNEVKTSSAKGNVDIYLTHFKSDIDALKTRNIISRPAHSLLFPGHGKQTDIEEWDVSLLCLILIHCCSFDGELVKLRDVFNEEVHKSRHNDVDLFLQANKETIAKLKGTEITDEQYNELFTAVGPTCFDKWDNSTLFCILFNLCEPNGIQKVLDILRNAVRHAVKLRVAKLDVDLYLKEQLKHITDLREDGSITQTQFNQLFPKDGGISDIYTWDNSLLCTVVVKVCKTLSQTTVKAVKTIRLVRNEDLAHKGHAELSSNSFLNRWTFLTKAITTILVVNVPSMQQQIEETINNLLEGPLDLKTSIEILKRHYLNDQQILKKLEDIEHDIHKAKTEIIQCVKDTEEGLRNHLDKKLKELMDTVQSKDGRHFKFVKPVEGFADSHMAAIKMNFDNATEQQPKEILILPPPKENDFGTSESLTAEEKRIYHCLRGEVHVSSDDKDAVAEAYQYIKEGIERRHETESSDSLMHSVGKFARGIEEHDAKIVGYSDGSVILHLQCESIAGLFNFIQYCKSEEMQASIMRIQSLLRRKCSRDIHMTMKINEEDLQKLLANIEFEIEQLRNEGAEKFKHSIRLLLECNSWDGMLEVWKMFNSGNASNELNILSEELSKRLGKTVKVTTSIPFDEFKRYVESAVRSSLLFQHSEEIQTADTGQYLPPALPSDEGLFNGGNSHQKETTSMDDDYRDLPLRLYNSATNMVYDYRGLLLRLYNSATNMDDDYRDVSLRLYNSATNMDDDYRDLSLRLYNSDTKMDDDYRDLSLRLNDVLKRVGASEKMRKLHHDTTVASEIMSTTQQQLVPHNQMSVYCFGSVYEKTTTPGLENSNFSSPIAPNMDDDYRELSLRLYDVLDWVGASEKMRKLRQDTTITMEIMETALLQLVLRSQVSLYCLGSSCEGTTTPGLDCDYDVLVSVDNFPVIVDIREAPALGLSFLMVRDEHIYPGYVKIQVVENGRTLTIYDRELLNDEDTDTTGKICLTHSISSISDFAHERHGPADTLIAFQCGNIPYFANEWIGRCRSYEWPSGHQLTKMSSLGCFVVGVGHPSSHECRLEWRLSFSLQERELMFSLNPTQHKCYNLLKMIKKEIINHFIGECISSYHCKTCIFYIIENTRAEIWRPDNLCQCLRLCLYVLMIWVYYGHCPNYFIPEVNMFDRPAHVRLRNPLLLLLYDLVSGVRRYLLELKCDNIGRVLVDIGGFQLYKTVDDENIKHEYSIKCLLIGKLLFFRNEVSKLVNRINDQKQSVIILSNILHALINIQTITEHTEQQTREALSYVIPVVHLQLAQSLVSLAFTTDDNDVIRQLIQRSNHHRHQGRKFDLSTARLMTATAFFKFRKYNTCEQILEKLVVDVKEHVKSQCGCQFCHDMVDKELVKVIRLDNPSLKAILKTLVSTCVIFLPSDMEIIPHPLRVEMYRSLYTPHESRNEYHDYWYDWAVVDGKVYLYFLQYLVYSNLNKHDHKDVAIEKLKWVIQEDPNLGHIETAYNLLGWIYTQEGRVQEAARCFLESWRIRPHHNATKWHMAILMFAMCRQ